MRRLLTVLMLGGMVLLVSEQSLAQKNWTIMVYMAADNDLEPAAIDDINEMEMVGSTADVNIVVQIDRIPGRYYTDPDWTTTRRYYITQDAYPYLITSQLVADLGEMNMGDPNTLSEFVDWAQNAYPASHYFLIIWNHGSGWHKLTQINTWPDSIVSDISATSTAGELRSSYGFHKQNSPIPSFPSSPFGNIGFKSAAKDSTDSDELFNHEIQSVLSSFEQLDILGFDACVMGMVEVAYQFRDQGAYLIASEENEPEDGWPYHDFLGYLSAYPTYSPAQLCSLVVLTYSDDMSSKYGNQQTLSAIDLSKIRAVASAVDELAYAIVGGSAWDEIYLMPSPDRFGGKMHYYDLYNFADLLTIYTSDALIIEKSSLLKEAISDAIVISRTETGHPYAFGLSIYFPQQYDPQFEFYNKHSKVDFADSTSWPTFLLCYFNGGTLLPDYPEPNDVYTQAGIPLSPHYYSLSWISSFSDVDWWLINSGIPETMTIVLDNPPDADFDIRLYSSDGISVLDSSSNSGSGIPDTIQYSSSVGEYMYLEIMGLDSYSTSPYGLELSQTGDQYGWFRLSFDDGTPDGGYYYQSAGNVLGSSYSLPTYPMILDRVWINFPSLSGAGGGNGSFYLLLYDNYGYVVDPMAIGLLTPSDTGWNYLDLTGINPSVYSNLFVGVWYDGTNTPVIGTDSHISGRDYFYDANTQSWAYLDKSLFFRIDVRYPTATGILEPNQNELTPSEFSLHQNYPNPFNASTVIEYETRTAGPVTLGIYNILGQRIYKQQLQLQTPGLHTFRWNGLNQAGAEVPSGIYFYRVSTNVATQSRKMVLLK